MTTYVRTFEHVEPPPRSDAPFPDVDFQEAPDVDGAPGSWSTIDTQALSPLDSDPLNPIERTLTTLLATLETGWYRLLWRDGTAIFPSDPLYFSDTQFVTPAGAVDIRVMVPRVRRATEGVGNVAELTDDEIKDLVADAIANVILYTGGVFGHELVVIERDENNSPVEYATDSALSLAEQSVVAAQAALDYFFFQFANTKISERIADEGQSWDWAKSANLLTEQLRLLIRLRDEAIAQVEEDNGTPLDAYESFIAVRDAHTSQLIEPWVEGAGGFGGQQQDWRFGGF